MANIKQLIQNYGLDVDDFDISPFESINLLHTRNEIHSRIGELSGNDRSELHKYDMLLIENAGRMYSHISKIYDFENSGEPLAKWWWHLDKVADRKLNVEL